LSQPEGLVKECRAFSQKCQGGGAATQLPAEQYHSGSNPDLGFSIYLLKLKEFLSFHPLAKSQVYHPKQSWMHALPIVK
jgi:hypothetical protein